MTMPRNEKRIRFAESAPAPARRFLRTTKSNSEACWSAPVRRPVVGPRYNPSARGIVSRHFNSSVAPDLPGIFFRCEIKLLNISLRPCAAAWASGLPNRASSWRIFVHCI